MRERAFSVGGSLYVGLAPGGGFLVEAVLPADRNQAGASRAGDGTSGLAGRAGGPAGGASGLAGRTGGPVGGAGGLVDGASR
jgi:hypothetical protein